MMDEAAPQDPPAPAAGGCLCGAVRYECHGAMRPVVNCHCRMCKKTHGHVAAYTAVAKQHLVISSRRGLKWYPSSAQARRGFCSECGASLFWEPTDRDYIAVSAGTLDPPTGLSTAGHVFAAEAGDYYEISDDLQQFPGSMRASEEVAPARIGDKTVRRET